MSEKNMWATLKPLIKSLDPVRIECPLSQGVPDVNYSNGWVELKYVKWNTLDPKVVPKIPHFTMEQRSWLARRWTAKALVWLLIRTSGNEWLLFDGWSAGRLIGRAPLYDLRTRSAACWPGLPDRVQLSGWLTGAPEGWAAHMKLVRLQACIDSFVADRLLQVPSGTVMKMEQGDRTLFDQLGSRLCDLYATR